MTLSPGARLGSFEIISPLGAGGMGEVYRARDTTLDRHVALKILPELFANDPERLARFEREAKTLAALNHPHIAQIHGLEASGSTRALVMELVEGEDLSARIAGGAIPLDEALPIARQIADALQAAHEQGIVHRDLKPANIKVRPDGTVKVLDFGLAKALEPVGGSGTSGREELLNSPTITSPAMTLHGMILGTAAYMAPEQAKGKVVDKRADVWAFGCVLYEMVTARRAFPGDDVSETLAAVIKSEPEWTRVPAPLRRLLAACLEKDPNRRLRDIGDVWKLVDDPSAATPATQVRRQSLVAWGAAAVALTAAAALAVIHFSEVPPTVEPVRFQIAAPENQQFDFYLALSPDERRLAFTARDASGTVRLWVHDLRTLESRVLAGTDQAWSPFWSPDSRHLAFAVGRQLKRIDTTGGLPTTLCEIEHNAGSGSWNADDVIIFGSRLGGPIYRVPAAGGRATAVTVLDDEQFHALPVFLPDGKHFIYLRQPRAIDARGIYVGSLDVEPARQSTTRVVATTFGASFAKSDAGGGWLLFVREGALVAQAFDPARLELHGDPQTVVSRIGGAGSAPFFSAAGPGALVYREGMSGAAGTDVQLSWIDRQGKALGEVGERGPVAGMALSPDNKRIAIGRTVNSQTPDIWMIDVARNLSTRLTFDDGVDMAPVWSPDATRLVYRSNRKGRFDLYERNLRSEEDRLVLASDRDKMPTDWSRDGRFILFETTGLKTRTDVWALPLQNPAQPIPVAQSDFDERAGSFSPDGRWIAYSSDESGRPEIYVRPFSAASDAAPAGGKVRISRDGAVRAKWSADGREIFFRAATGPILSAPVSVRNGVLDAGVPVQLFITRSMLVNIWDATADGQRFLVGASVQEAPVSTPVTVMLNWQAGLGK